MNPIPGSNCHYWMVLRDISVHRLLYLVCLVIFHINPANHAPGIQIGNILRDICSHRLIIIYYFQLSVTRYTISSDGQLFAKVIFSANSFRNFIRVSKNSLNSYQAQHRGAQWLNGRVLDSRPRGSGFKPH